MTKRENIPGIPDASETLEILNGSSFVQEAKKEKALRLNEQRKLAFEMRSRADAELLKHNQAKAKRIAAGLAAIEAAQKTLDEARIAYGTALGADARVNLQLDQQFDEATNILVETSDPSITLFIAEMRDAWEKTRRELRVGPETTMRNMVTGKIVTRAVESNAVSVRDRVKAIQDAIRIAEDMRLDVDQSRVPERLEKLRGDLPAVSP